MKTIETDCISQNLVNVLDEKRLIVMDKVNIKTAIQSYPNAIIRKEKMFINFSGGKTSAYMTKILKDNYSDQYDFIIVFANTGQEHNKTLEFIDKCNREFNFNLNWIEAVVNPIKGKATKHKIVNFHTATRIDSYEGPFQDVIKKYGIPNMAARNVCTRDLKLQPIRSFRKTIEGYKDALTAIGIRIDEPKRLMGKKEAGWEKENIIYPLAHWFKSDKQDVNDFWEDQSFNLEIEEYEGNCVWCWKKSLRKHLTIIAENPLYFSFPRLMEEKYPRTNVREDCVDRKFFRQHMSTNDLFELAKTFSKIIPRKLNINLDENSGCSESCEIF